jgi:hypothetical protein
MAVGLVQTVLVGVMALVLHSYIKSFLCSYEISFRSSDALFGLLSKESLNFCLILHTIFIYSRPFPYTLRLFLTPPYRGGVYITPIERGRPRTGNRLAE